MGVKLNQADLEFILRQIKISEAHAAGTPLTEIYVDPEGNVVAPGTPGAALAIPDPHVPYGLRTVDGTYNHLEPGRETWGAADQPMPRLFDASYLNDTDGDSIDFDGPGPAPALVNGNYGASGDLVDADPREISNLIADMSFNNPAAIVAALTHAGSETIYGPGGTLEGGDLETVQTAYATLISVLGDAGATEPDKEAAQTVFDDLIASLGIEAANGSIILPNVAPDEGLSAPFNAWMTFFGQFFDHGLDLITKGGNGTIYVPLAPDDPLITHGPDGIPNSGDEVPPQMAFMVLTRATPDGESHTNTTTPFVDQNQTYTSHPSHQVFLREYELDENGHPITTGRLLDGDDGGLPTWADIKAQARDMLGIELTDNDILNLPLLRTDQYGNFIPDPVTGNPQLVIGLGPDGIPNTADDVTVSGTPSDPVNTFAENAIRTAHAFLDDIAHNAVPGMYDSDGDHIPDAFKTADSDTDISGPGDQQPFGTYDDELLDRHFITGDGRGNENIGLTAVHHIFHSEHNRQVEAQKATILASGDLDFINEWLLEDVTTVPTSSAGLHWDGERLFQAGKFATEMQYQHLVFEEFARKIQPNIDPFVFNNVTDVDPSIFAEFANTVYRFGHSMLTDDLPRLFADGTGDDVGLITAFLNPVLFNQNTATGQTVSADEASAAVIRGLTEVQGNEIDEFVVGALRNNLLGLPLDLPAINIARGRDTGVPTLNEAREQLYAASSSTFLKPYENWIDFAANLKNPISIINFIAAYGTHETITGTLDQKRDAAILLVMGGNGAPVDRMDFLTSTGSWEDVESGLNTIDLWIGGLAEAIMPFGGMLGSTFNAIFELQMENLQDGDRFYYLSRTQGQNFLTELENNSFAKLIMANTDIAQPGADGIRGTDDDVVTHHIGVDVFANYEHVLEVNEANQLEPDPVGNDPILEALGMGKVQRDDLSTPGADANYIRYTGGEHIVIGGTEGNDTIISGFGDDGIWGDAGDDRIESGAGVDLVNGGAGDDIITDSGDSGDFLKGDDGNDVIANSNGLDVIMGGRGKDAVFVGVDDTEVFGGEGDDFILGGDGVDFLLGGEGDDWIEAGGGFDTTAGDNSELFFNSAIVGHDVMFAGNDEHDFDAESGDDIMVQGESVMRNEGMFGFDWSIFKGVSFDARGDLRVPIFTTEQADILRNRFDKVEALSGWVHDDILTGDDRVAGVPAPGATVGTTEGIFFNDGLNQEGIDRIDGLSEIVSLEPGQEFFEGNILIGGAGSDILQGNGGNDIIDGDRWLNVRISIRDNAGNEIGTVDSMKHVFDSSAPNVALGWAGKSLFELMVDRVISPTQLHIVREILTDSNPDDIDVAVFNDVFENYTVIADEETRTLTVRQDVVSDIDDPLTGRPLLSDDTDIVRNVEQLRFSDGNGGFVFINTSQFFNEPATGAPVIDDLTPTEGQTLTADVSSIQDENGLGPLQFQWQMSTDGGSTWTNTWDNAQFTSDATFVPNEGIFGFASQVGSLLRVRVSFTDAAGFDEALFSAPTGVVGDNWTRGFFTGSTFNGTEGDDIALGGDTFFGAGIADILNGNGGDDFLSGRGGNDSINGGAGNDTIDAGSGNDSINGGAGDDSINAGSGNDTIAQLSTDGRDIIDGGTGVDTYQLNGVAGSETFTVYSRAAALANISGLTLAASTEIVIARNGVAIAELDNIEEIRVNTLQVTSPGGAGGGANGGDTIQVIGDFTGTSLNFNTITIDGTPGDDTIDITSLQSAHRIVFKSNGGNDTIIGDLRPQDVIELPNGSSVSDYVETTENGMTTLSNGTHSITFPSSGSPTVAEGPPEQGAFALTARDMEGLKNLVNGNQPFGDEDDVGAAVGVRELLGSNNNLANPEFGAADEVFIRLTNAHYGNFNQETNNRDINPIFRGLDARNISNILGTQEANLPKQANNANIFFMSFGQYFDHGLDFILKDSAFGTLPIGGADGGGFDPNNPADLTRGAVEFIDEFGVPQHLNKTSPFADQNQAYGSHELVGQFLRESDGNQGFGMHLLAGEPDPSAPEYNLLPTLRELIQHHWQANTIFVDDSLPGGAISFRDYYSDYPIDENATGSLFDEATGAYDPDVLEAVASNFMGSGHALLLDTNPYVNLLDHYVAGDGRANENFALTSMHTIWARNHNWHVENLLESGFVGTPEEVFQAAKMINEAEYQRVVFDEFADMLLGGMRGDGTHGHLEYNPDADARISHEFAAAVYRVGHSLIGQTLTVLDENGATQQVALFDAFLNPSNDGDVFSAPLPVGYTPQPGYEQLGVSSILGGIAGQPAEEVDFNLVDAVRNDLVRIRADLFSFNVTRAWDVGLGTLNQVRIDLMASDSPYIQEAIGFAGDLSPYESWDDFQDRNGLSDTVIQQFMQAYPDLVLEADEIEAFGTINPNIALIDNGDTTFTVKGIDRVDLWVGGLAEAHINGGVVGQTFWVVLHEQFDRLQEGDRLYYADRFDNFDFYEEFVDNQQFSDIIARNSNLENLPEKIFEVSDTEITYNPSEGTGTGNPPDDTPRTPDDEIGAPETVVAEAGAAGEAGAGATGAGRTGASSGASSLYGTAARDNLVSSSASQILKGFDGRDTLKGRGGNDTLIGGDDNDKLYGGSGRDKVYGGNGNDLLKGGSNNDRIKGDNGSDRLHGNSGHDTIIGGRGHDRLYGDSGNDRLQGGSGNDKLYGDSGHDLLEGGGGSDRLYGGGGKDTLIGGTGNDVLDGGSDNDVLRGQSGNDKLFGGSGDDRLYGDSGNDQLYGGTGDDTLNGNDGDDILFGDDGNDLLLGGEGADILHGGIGNDVLRGEAGNDEMYGDEGMDVLEGGDGDDELHGGSGNDTLEGGAGLDTLYGEEGADRFLFRSASDADGDVIEDFETGDRIDLSFIDADAGTGGDQAFTLVTGSGFNAAGALRVTQETRDGVDYTVVEGNIDGGTDAEFKIDIKGHHDLNSNDFNL